MEFILFGTSAAKATTKPAATSDIPTAQKQLIAELDKNLDSLTVQHYLALARSLGEEEGVFVFAELNQLLCARSYATLRELDDRVRELKAWRCANPIDASSQTGACWKLSKLRIIN